MTARLPALRLARRLLLGFGILALAYTGGALAYASLSQRHDAWAFGQDIARRDSRFEASSPEDPQPMKGNATLREGDVVGKLEIPRIGVSVMILHGVGQNALLGGVGHMPATPLPGAEGNVVLAGHRDTYFRRLEAILPGDGIRITTVAGTYEYAVDTLEVVGPHDTWVMESRSRSELTLITCYPFYFIGPAPERFIVHATPVL